MRLLKISGILLAAEKGLAPVMMSHIIVSSDKIIEVDED